MTIKVIRRLGHMRPRVPNRVLEFTALHGLHLMGGLVVLSNVAFRVWYDEAPDALAAPLKLCTTYWHFLLGVWLVLFALLTSTPETINALAAMCGF